MNSPDAALEIVAASLVAVNAFATIAKSQCKLPDIHPVIALNSPAKVDFAIDPAAHPIGLIKQSSPPIYFTFCPVAKKKLMRCGAAPIKIAATKLAKTARRPKTDWEEFWEFAPRAHIPAPKSKPINEPTRAQAAMPLAICCNAALPGSAVVEGERFTDASNTKTFFLVRVFQRSWVSQKLKNSARMSMCLSP